MPQPTVSFTVRLDPAIHSLLRRAAGHQRRSMTNLLEVLIAEHCPALLPFDPFDLDPPPPGIDAPALAAGVSD